MSLRLQYLVPNLTPETTKDLTDLYEYLGMDGACFSITQQGQCRTTGNKAMI